MIVRKFIILVSAVLMSWCFANASVSDSTPTPQDTIIYHWWGFKPYEYQGNRLDLHALDNVLQSCPQAYSMRVQSRPYMVWGAILVEVGVWTSVIDLCIPQRSWPVVLGGLAVAAGGEVVAIFGSKKIHLSIGLFNRHNCAK